ERPLRPLETVHLVAGDRFRVEMPGGGGYGDPLSRDPARVLNDVLDGIVSIDAAERDYGVVIEQASMTVDAAQTARIRTERQSPGMKVEG
ncbi:MAG TPA: hydantoinase B/oxoprolinase family protein, partial [Candidatus Binatia bacterium]